MFDLLPFNHDCFDKMLALKADIVLDINNVLLLRCNSLLCYQLKLEQISTHRGFELYLDNESVKPDFKLIVRWALETGGYLQLKAALHYLDWPETLTGIFSVTDLALNDNEYRIGLYWEGYLTDRERIINRG